MTIEFKIQLDDNGPTISFQPGASNPAATPMAHTLGQVFSDPKNDKTKGGDGPMSGTGTGAPHSSGMGGVTVFVLGPIVICGPGGHVSPHTGGDGPMSGTGTGGPKADNAPEPGTQPETGTRTPQGS